MMKNKQIILFVLLILIASFIMAEGREVIVIGYDGTTNRGELRSWDMERIEVASDGKITAVRVGTVSVVYFVGGSGQNKPTDLTNTVSYTLNGKPYTLGIRNHKPVLYGPDWV